MVKRKTLAFYGDDFTGSTDAMEALHQYGWRTILFLEPPNDDMLELFKDVDCIGVAGTARAKNRTGMEEELRPVFERFKVLNPYYVHYKVCSTFDSSSDVGSIGFAGDLAREYFDKGTYPVLVGAPTLGRYTVFGNHFANFYGTVYRLDQHPVMSKHPSTPMDEADLKSHLEKQTKQSIGNITILDMEETATDSHVLDCEKDMMIYDAVDDKHIAWFGEVLKENKKENSLFVIGSSGVEYALGKVLEKENTEVESKLKPKSDIEEMFVVSGSVSEVTKRQLEEAEQAGFYMIQVPYRLLSGTELPEEFLNGIVETIRAEKKAILYTAKGTEDPSIQATKEHLVNHGIAKEDIGRLIGKQLGKWTKYIMENIELKRIVVSGGDTSGFVTSQLGIFGLEVLDSIAPGAPLCRAYSDDERFNNLEIALKSGQLGGENFFENVFMSGKRRFND